MATWGAHIRIADYILDNGINLEKKEFVVGNIGPDCNRANEDWTAYIPSKKITHWYDETNKMNPENFYNKYIKDIVFDDLKYKSFIVGYYTHLLSDVEWWGYVKSEILGHDFFERLYEDRNIKWELDEDWFQHDVVYLKNTLESSYYKILPYVDEFPIYLDYFNKNDFEDKIEYIRDYYENYKIEEGKKFKYVDSETIERIFERTLKTVIETLKKRGLY